MKRYRDVAVITLGTTPQVVTEGLWSLQSQRRPVIADDLVIVTTESGRDILQRDLVESGIWEAFITCYHLEHLRDLERHIHLIPAGDIVTDDEGRRMGEVLFTVVQKIAQGPETRIHAFLTGGRKSMSFYMGLVLSLLARPRDRLYHLFVSPPSYENDETFFYPEKGHPATVILSPVPFPRLKEMLMVPVTSLDQAMRETQRSLQSAIVLPPLTLSLAERCLHIGRITLPLPPTLLMLYAIFILQKRRHCTHPERSDCEGCHDCFITLYEVEEKARELYPALYEKIYPGRPFLMNDMKRRLEKVSHEILRQHISRLRRVMREGLPVRILSFVTIHSLRAYAATRYGIIVGKDLLSIKENV